MQKCSIIIFLMEIKYSGAAKIATWLANRLSSKNEVHFVTLKGEKGNLNDRIDYCCLEIKKSSKIGFYYESIRELRRYLKRNHSDVVLTLMPIETMLLSIASFGLGVKLISSERSDPYFEKSLFATFCRKFYSFASLMVFQTENAQSFFPKRIQRNSVIIHNPIINKQDCSPIDYSKRSHEIAYTGRLFIKQKRQDVLIEAMRIVHDYDPSIVLAIYGDGPDEAILKKMVAEKKLDNCVFFYGRIDNVLERIRTSKVFVFSSDYEGIPNSIIEALSMEVPVVTTDCSPGGARILVENDINGYIVPRADSKELAMKVIKALSNGERLSRNCSKTISQFHENVIFCKWCTAISMVIRNEKTHRYTIPD